MHICTVAAFLLVTKTVHHLAVWLSLTGILQLTRKPLRSTTEALVEAKDAELLSLLAKNRHLTEQVSAGGAPASSRRVSRAPDGDDAGAQPTVSVPSPAAAAGLPAENAAGGWGGALGAGGSVPPSPGAASAGADGAAAAGYGRSVSGLSEDSRSHGRAASPGFALEGLLEGSGAGQQVGTSPIPFQSSDP